MTNIFIKTEEKEKCLDETDFLEILYILHLIKYPNEFGYIDSIHDRYKQQ